MKRPFGRETTLLRGLTNHGFLPLPNWDDPPSKGPLYWANLSQPEAEETLEKPLDVLVMISAFSFFGFG